MECPSCQHTESKVVDSRDAVNSTRRRRECLACGHRFTTFERIEYRLPTVIKRDGRQQTFNPEKLLVGLRLAARKRPLHEEQLTAMVAAVEQQLSRRTDKTVTTSQIGELALEQLRNVDHVAYIRFASVYQVMEKPEDFLRILQPLLPKAEEGAP